MKKYLKLIAVAVLFIGTAVACEQDNSSDELTTELATEGDKVKRPGGGN